MSLMRRRVSLMRCLRKLATDDRMLRAKAWLRFIEVLNGAPSLDVLQAACAADASDFDQRHLLGVHLLLDGAV